MTVIDDVERFIMSELGLAGTLDGIRPDEDLLAGGIVDSHGLMELIAFLGERYGVVVADEELTPENFQTLARIEALVRRSGGDRR